VKKKPKAPWYIDRGISEAEDHCDRIEKALGLCHGCVHTRVGGPELPDGTPGIRVTCGHPERQGPGKGLSTDKECPHWLGIESEDPELEKLYKGPLEKCDRCKGTGLMLPGVAPGSPCPQCFGTGAQQREPCPKCHDTGVIETGNNDLPCECPAGDMAEFSVAGRSKVKGSVLKAEWERSKRLKIT